MINIRKYNYYTWFEGLKKLGFSKDKCGDSLLDVGAGDGAFLRYVLDQGYGKYGIGLDIILPETGGYETRPNGTELELLHADIVNQPILQLESGIDTTFFMNMLYVIPLDQIMKFLNHHGSENLIISYPQQDALDLFEKRRPGVNLTGNSLEIFCEQSGYTVHKDIEITSGYYLRHPIRCALGSVHPILAQMCDRMGRSYYYRLAWLKRKL